MADFQKFTATASGTVYTADSDDVIIGCLISNTGSTTAQVDVSLASTSLVTNLQIPAGGSVELVRGKLVAVSGDALELTIDSGTVALYLSVLNEAS